MDERGMLGAKKHWPQSLLMGWSLGGAREKKDAKEKSKKSQ